MGEVHLGAGTIIQDESGRILLVQEGKEHIKGQWNIPSGGYDGDETIEEAAKRETLEETGLEVELEGVIGIYTRDAERKPDVKNVMIVFEASKTGGTLKSGYQDEILDAGYFEPEEIQDLGLRFNFQNVIEDFQDRGSKELPLHHYDI
jgi:8-oxo-dGTP diphosphatase